MYANLDVNIAFVFSLFFLLPTIHSGDSNNRPSGSGSSDLIAFPDHYENLYRMQQNGGHRPEPPQPTYQSMNYANSTNEVPSLDFIYKISNFTVGDLLLNFVDEYEEDHIIANRFGDDEEVERSAAITPKPATCMPELTTIKLITSNDPSILYIPSCTRIERCGGCCSHNLLTCQPKDSEIISFKVVKTQFTGGNRLKFVGKEIIHVEKHTKCICGCRIQESDCNTFQEYHSNECKCICKNTDEEKKCYKNNNTKLWDPDLCACQCREITPCSTGYSFDAITCRCAPTQMRRRYIQEHANDAILEQRLVPTHYQNEN